MLNKKIINKLYKTFIFDCDGVILNSNNIKSNAFYETALIFSEEIAQKFLIYHKNNGGISRYLKFNYLLEHLVENNINNITQSQLLNIYANNIKAKLLNSEVSSGLLDFKNKYNKINWIVISGGDQDELRSLFDKKGITHFFDKGIYGSPKNKIEIIKYHLEHNNLQTPALFFGDSVYDYEVSKYFNFDFVFVSNWTELDDWSNFCKKNKIKHIPNLEYFKSNDTSNFKKI